MAYENLSVEHRLERLEQLVSVISEGVRRPAARAAADLGDLGLPHNDRLHVAN